MYTDMQLDELHEASIETMAEVRRHMENYLLLSDQLNEQAREHALYGISRRLSTIHECFSFFFSEVPPEINYEIDRELRATCDIHLHAYLINLCGIMDNIAWMWAYSSGLQDRVDLERNRVRIGLFNNWFIPNLPLALQELVNTYRDWYEFTIDHRHPTAHRIPPYIVPYVVHENQEGIQTPSYILRFCHSGNEPRLVNLHPQVIADTRTINLLLTTTYNEMI